ncbi:MAG: hypothetical protein ACI80V_000957 [Rhodothermales bacterium]|jgi:hypothetical protein
MKPEINTGRIAGVLLLLVFALGVLTFQFLQSPVLSGVEHFENVAPHSSRIIASALTGMAIGSLSILVALTLLPVFRRASEGLAFAYVAFAVTNFVAIAIDTVSVMSILEMSRIYAADSALAVHSVDSLVTLVYKQQWWTHHLYLLTSCLPVLVMFSGFYVSRGIPKAISLFGILAAVTMAIGVIGAMLGNGMDDRLFIPIALVQVTTPLWLVARGIAVKD